MPGILEYALIAPELLLAIMACFLLLASAFIKKDGGIKITRAAIISVIAAIFILANFWQHPLINKPQYAFNWLVITDNFGIFVKLLLSVAAVFVLLLTLHYRINITSEHPVLILFGLIGMMVMVSSNDMLSLYLGLELQSLCLYVLVSINRDDGRSSEAGLKYFILGALASGILLFGISLIYGFTGTVNFSELSRMYHCGTNIKTLPVGVLAGLILVMIAIFFKVSAVPFHMWTPDVYQGAPTTVTAFLASVPKIAAIALLARVLLDPFLNLKSAWQQIVIVISVLTMLVGAIAAIKQTNIKRLLAYSSIGHVGYMLMGFASFGYIGLANILIYLSIYIFMTAGAFGVVLLMKRNGKYVEEISDLAGFSKTSPVLAFVMAVMMFSMAGIPPLAGFFGKFYIFLGVIQSKQYLLAVVGVLASVIAAYYYLRIIKIMYFENPDKELKPELSLPVIIVLSVATIFNVFFFIYPSLLTKVTYQAAKALFL